MSRKVSKVLIGIVVLAAVLVTATFFALPKSGHASEASNTVVNLADFSFVKVGNTHYSVALSNKTLKKVVVPSEYNGLPVKEITTNGFANCKQLEEVLIPQSIKTIGNGAFLNDTMLRTVKLTAVQTVGQNAFAMCGALETVNLPSTVTTVGANAFRMTAPNIYTSLSMGQTAVWTNWLSSFSGNVIYDFEDLEFREINDEFGETIGYSLVDAILASFSTTLYCIDYHDEGKGKGSLPVLNIEPWAFSFCELDAVAIGLNSEHDISVETYAFAYSNIKSVFFSDNVYFADYDDGVPDGIFANAEVEIVVLPSTLNFIPSAMFIDCESLLSVSYVGAPSLDNRLSPAVTAIGDHAFENCKNLADLRIPQSVIAVDGWAFRYWDNTQKIYVANDESAINWNAGWYTESNATVIYDEIIASLAFGEIKGTVIEDGEEKKVVVAYIVTSVGYLKNASAIAIPETYNNKPVVEIGYMAFFNCVNLVSVSMPSITTIGSLAFDSCISLSSVYAPEATTLKDHAFSMCISLTHISFPKVTKLEDCVFKHCEGLLSLDMPNDLPLVTELDTSSFMDCFALTSVVLNDNLTRIGGGAFAGCKNLTTIEIPASVLIIWSYAFEDCIALTTVNVNKSAVNSNEVTVLSDLTVFSGCTSLQCINVPDSASKGAYQNAVNWSYYALIICTL